MFEWKAWIQNDSLLNAMLLSLKSFLHKFSSKLYNMPTAIVTGASAGIGAGTTARLLRDGWNVILIARSTDKMQKLVSNYPSSSYKIISSDLSKPELLLTKIIPEIKEYISSNTIDLLVNNAGGTHGGSKKKYRSNENLLSSFNWHINLMLTTPYLLTRYLSNMNLFSNKASVINIGSLAAHYGSKDSMAYAIAKNGVQGLTKCLAFELARKNKKNVRVNNLELGYVKTDIAKQSVPNITQQQEDLFWNSFGKVTPLQRSGTVKDIVEMIIFLADDDKSGWITGQDIVIDGGISLPLFHARPKL